MTHYQNLAEHLTKRSNEICTDNECTEDDHNCRSFAYIQVMEMRGVDGKTYIDAMLLDICMSDYFQGCMVEYIALPMPWSGSASDLKADIEQEWLSLA